MLIRFRRCGVNSLARQRPSVFAAPMKVMMLPADEGLQLCDAARSGIIKYGTTSPQMVKIFDSSMNMKVGLNSRPGDNNSSRKVRMGLLKQPQHPAPGFRRPFFEWLKGGAFWRCGAVEPVEDSSP